MFDKKVLRTLQTSLPDIRRLKFGAYNLGTRHLGFPVEDEFRLLTRLHGVNLAIDVGGNWGQSIEALRRFAKPNRILSFEPNPELGRRLAQRFARSDMVTVERLGLADTDGEMTLYVPSYNGFVFDGLASLSRSDAETWLTPDRMIRFDPAKLRISEHKVRITTLDSFGLKPDILKIDVQGFEANVLRGARQTLAASRPVTIVEEPNAEVVELLGEFGLVPYSILDRTLVEGVHRTRNTLFLDSAKYEQLRVSP